MSFLPALPLCAATNATPQRYIGCACDEMIQPCDELAFAAALA
jgi:hypothetical protein